MKKSPVANPALTANPDMLDQFGRQINYLRISVTDRCNLRCTYCMPAEGINFLPHTEILTFEEIVHLVEIMAEHGLEYVRLTGGEPTVRRGLPDLVALLNAIPGIKGIGITTNGLLLTELLDDLITNGLTSLNISVDTLKPDLFKQITRRDSFDQFRKSLNFALSRADQCTIKLNCVLNQNNRAEWAEIARLTEHHPISVRFIEMMPIGLGKIKPRYAENLLREELTEKLGDLIPLPSEQHPTSFGPGRYERIEGYKGNIGFISAISHAFCDQCNRLRLTATGFLKTCLQYSHGADLKAPLRSGASDEEIWELIAHALATKPRSHQFTNSQQIESQETKNMHQIGG